MSNIKKYRKKPVVIEAQLITYENRFEVAKWCNAFAPDTTHTDGILVIDTLEGQMWAQNGDYIIKGVKGEFYPCKPDIFEATYDFVPPPSNPVPASRPNPALMELPSSTLEAIERKHGQSEALRIAKLPAVEQHAELHRLIQFEKEEASND